MWQACVNALVIHVRLFEHVLLLGNLCAAPFRFSHTTPSMDVKSKSVFRELTVTLRSWTRQRGSVSFVCRRRAHSPSRFRLPGSVEPHVFDVKVFRRLCMVEVTVAGEMRQQMEREPRRLAE